MIITAIISWWRECFHIAYIHDIQHFFYAIQKNALRVVREKYSYWTPSSRLAATKSLLQEHLVELNEVMQVVVFNLKIPSQRIPKDWFEINSREMINPSICFLYLRK